MRSKHSLFTYPLDSRFYMMPKVLYQFPQCAGKTFMPSNGTEGMIFTTAFCENCIHEKFIHTAQDGDKQCDIFSRSILHWYEPEHPDYPKEWIYDKEGWPICTAWKKWDWGRDDEGGWNDPPEPEPYNPNQLVFPFMFDEIFDNTIPKTQKELDEYNEKIVSL